MGITSGLQRSSPCLRLRVIWPQSTASSHGRKCGPSRLPSVAIIWRSKPCARTPMLLAKKYNSLQSLPLIPIASFQALREARNRNTVINKLVVGTVKFEARIKELVENLPDLAELVEPLLVVRRVLREQFVIQHRRLLAIVRDDEVCRRLMTVPGVGPVVALTYRATVDVPARFRKSKSVGAVFGLTCAKHQSGE